MPLIAIAWYLGVPADIASIAFTLTVAAIALIWVSVAVCKPRRSRRYRGY